MDGRTAAGTVKSPLECQHKRLLEGVYDHQGKKIDIMKCCECGDIVPHPASSKMPLR